MDQGQPVSLSPPSRQGRCSAAGPVQGCGHVTMRGMTIEIELKFRIPAGRLAALRRAVATSTARTVPLAAVYLDTADERLAQARVALRLRREGAVWVQTLKAEGASDLQRLEHNVALGDSPVAPALDIGRHGGTAAGERLRLALGVAEASALGARYATDIQRTRRVLRSGGARIELALDEGWISAGGQRLAVCELEFELLSGPPQALLDLAGRWVDRFELMLDMRSKSERGHLLAAGRWASAPAKAESPPLQKRDSPAQAFAAMLGAALRPLLRQASLLADADLAELVADQPEHLHQLRVGLRRLRTVLAVFGDQQPAAELAPALAALFRQTGGQRDQDVLAATLWPALRAAGAPLVEWPPLAHGEAAGPLDSAVADGATLGALLATPAVQRLWLALLATAQAPPADDGAAPSAALRPVLRLPLDKLLRQLHRDAARFEQLDDAQRHRLRRRIKRLRYALESSATLWPARALASMLKRLRQAQDLLGEFNDCGVALALYRDLAANDARAWFAVGWISAHRQALLPPCARALVRLARQAAPWRKR